MKFLHSQKAAGGCLTGQMEDLYLLLNIQSIPSLHHVRECLQDQVERNVR
jgi:hypothetical protein